MRARLIRALYGYVVKSKSLNQTPEPFDSFVGCSKILLVLSSSLGILGWIYVCVIALPWYGFPKTLFEAFVLFYPFIYLSAGIYCCWVNIPRPTLYIIAMLLNVPLVAISTYWLLQSGTFPFGLIVCILFVVLWAFLCVARGYSNDTAA